MSIALAEEVVSEAAKAAENVTEGRLTLDVGNNLLYAILGYLVVFIGLALLMIVIIIVGKIMVSKMKQTKLPAADTEAVAAEAAEVPAVKALPAAPGTAGEVKIYDTDPKDAAMIMAIVANKLQKPLNELRFVSIKEVK
jgi:Na+-transporting methylmalonyl-CoA/oxaloacetate decarboxylase gamma subunit